MDTFSNKKLITGIIFNLGEYMEQKSIFQYSPKELRVLCYATIEKDRGDKRIHISLTVRLIEVIDQNYKGDIHISTQNFIRQNSRINKPN